jgi:hypothetical protein
MNDSTKCSEGLLVISSRSSLPSAELDKLRRTIEPLADEMGLRPLALCDGLEVSAVVDYTPLLTRLCAAVEALVAQGEPPQGLGSSDAESAPQALNARPRERDAQIASGDAQIASGGLLSSPRSAPRG